ncbi:hypothetical protein VVD49_21020 [Uliginosibacterium sp. H3]|uniref:Uncharacterized protein n=1 Tax=Uliginosibacterium silvisoli TaxID=3114758 RepID=A0ABU6KBA2_9RHOO|nr:hypothetical protein [Uliginosibacterium sp. H3]
MSPKYRIVHAGAGHVRDIGRGCERGVAGMARSYIRGYEELYE